jgi:hypothetical protein
MLEAATPATVGEFLAAAAPSLLLTVPADVDVDEDVSGACDQLRDDPPVEGTVHEEARIGRHRAALVVGDEAVALRFGDGLVVARLPRQPSR